MVIVPRTVTVAGGVGSVVVNTKVKIKAIAFMVPAGPPTYDYYITREDGVVVEGKSGMSDDTTLRESDLGITEMTLNAGWSINILNATVNGNYNVSISSELQKTYPVQR